MMGLMRCDARDWRDGGVLRISVLNRQTLVAPADAEVRKSCKPISAVGRECRTE